ncbi:hypothetical protein R3X25_04645 [Lutibacter sp. TH_r2]|uniref:hypothetical protein n=1 Tax=Lutibacter sp. TH_r2 TaxID=3082083 RepID=UPI0029547E40|nr:hypothetical protein [Lutibacter sp. TH_r2]MDV7186561.1 hypothetical protein [Lutibacter sp. TH_r2]
MKRITKEEAIELNQNFINTKGNALDEIVEKLNKKPKEKDACSSWFSIEELQSFIDDCKKANTNVNGFRVYFGAYGKKDKTKKNLSTVFIVPTEAKVGAKQKECIESEEQGGTDIPDLGGLNNGHVGDPPSAQYPQ